MIRIFEYKKLLILSLLIVFSLSLFPQKKSLRFQHYSINNGLPHNLVDCILQDQKGFMWFGTWNGLCRFDGYSFKQYRKNIKDYPTISSNLIYSLCEDFNGNIWIGTDAGINIYKYSLDTFLIINNDNLVHESLGKKVTAIVKENDSILWIGTSDGLGRAVINERSSINNYRIYPFGNTSSNVSGTFINHIMIDREKNVWVATNEGISILQKETEHFDFLKKNPKDFNSIPFNNVKCIFEDSRKNIWIATEHGLCKYNRSVNQFRNFFHHPDMDFTLPHNYIMSVIEDDNGNILIGTFGGLSIYKNDNTNRFTNYKEDVFSEYSLNNDYINCLYKDKDGIIWIGTERGGINKYRSTKTQFEYFENEIGKKNTLSNNVINAIFEDEKNIWIGTSGGGLNRYNKESGLFKTYQYDSKSELPHFTNFVADIHRDKNNNLWIGSWGGGLYKMTHENTPQEKFINYNPQESDNSLINSYIASIVSDDSGNLYIGTYEGLDKYDVSHDHFYHISSDPGQVKMQRIGDLLLDHANNLWAASQNGLFKVVFINKNQYRVTYFKNNEKRKSSLSDNYTTSILEDTDHNIWIGTYGFGLNKLVSEDSGGVFIHYNIEDGLPNNIIYTITQDKTGNLWMTTAYGLSRMNVKENKFTNYYISDGLQNNEYFWNAAYINKNGKLYFGGMRGLNSFYPEMISSSQKDSNRLIITDFKIYGEPVKVGKKYDRKTVLSASILTSGQITVSYKSREISFEFSALNYDQPDYIRYAYKLEGFENKWNEVSADRRFASYTNLRPGDYILKLKTSYALGEWDENITEMKLRVIPPFWATWGFRLALIALLVASVISYNRYRLYTLKKQKRKLEEQVIERTSEIEKQKEKLKNQNEQIHKQRDKLFELNKKVKLLNESKLTFFTNISHEFKTPLALISGPIEKILDKENLSENVKKSLLQVNKNAQRLLHLINQLMDFRKIEKGKMKLHISCVNILHFMNKLVEAFMPLAEQKNITFLFESSEIKGDTWIDYEKLEDILYNLLSNAFKFTGVNGKVLIQVHENISFPGRITMQVSDTGIGISQEKQENIFKRFYQVETSGNTNMGTGIGLALTKELVECHKGTIEVKSIPEQGTTFIINLPVRKEYFFEDEIADLSYHPEGIKKQVSKLIEELTPENSFNQTYKFRKNRINILVVEDDPELKDFVAKNLYEKYNISLASNGKEGFDMASELNPDMIISDIMMPEMNGLEFCRLIKNNLMTSHIPFILLTAKTEVEDEIGGLEHGADRYITKPFHFNLLEANIVNLIETRKKLYDAFRFQMKLDTKILATTNTDENFLNKIVRVIVDNIDNTELSVTFLSEKMLMSRGHLYTKLQSLSNLSPSDFINNIRLKKSLELLQNSQLNISEIAYSVGYSDPKYFSRIFKKHFGKTPTEYQDHLMEKN